MVRRGETVNEGYWALFCATGDPLFYLLCRMEEGQTEQQAKTAWHERSVELV